MFCQGPLDGNMVRTWVSGCMPVESWSVWYWAYHDESSGAGVGVVLEVPGHSVTRSYWQDSWGWSSHHLECPQVHSSRDDIGRLEHKDPAPMHTIKLEKNMNHSSWHFCPKREFKQCPVFCFFA